MFTLAPPKTTAIKMSFGAGGWSRHEVQKLVDFLTIFGDSVAIEKPENKLAAIVEKISIDTAQRHRRCQHKVVVTDQTFASKSP